jgi:hypothetical protein
VEYDSNVTVEPDSDGDVGFVLSGGGRYDLVERRDALVRLEYDLYQSLHVDIHDFDLRWQRPRGTASYALLPQLWAGVQGGYNYFTLGDQTYLGEPFVMPFVSFLQGGWGLTQVLYRSGFATYFSTPFNDVRDGPDYAVAVNQTVSFGEGGQYLTFGYQFEAENPRRAVGNDYQFVSNQGYVGLGLPLRWRAFFDFTYLYRNDNYTKPNSQVDFRKTRQDNGHHFVAGLSRLLTEHLSAGITYYGIINNSNIGLFEYRRNVIGGYLQVTY